MWQATLGFFWGQPAPLPMETHTLVQGCGFPLGLTKPLGSQTHHRLRSHIIMILCHPGFLSSTTQWLPPLPAATKWTSNSTCLTITNYSRNWQQRQRKDDAGLKMSGVCVFFVLCSFLLLIISFYRTILGTTTHKNRYTTTTTIDPKTGEFQLLFPQFISLL